jgi:hypothetical protein
MVDRQTLMTFGNGVFRMKKKADWYAYLELLDRDLSFLVFCRPCGSIHAPGLQGCVDTDINSQWPRARGAMKYRKRFPPFGTVHAIMRNYRAGRDYRELLNEESLCKAATIPDLAPCMGLTGLRIAHGAGHLIRKSELFWNPSLARDTNPRTLFAFGRAVWLEPSICRHRAFVIDYGFTLPDTRKFVDHPIFRYVDGTSIPLPTGTKRDFDGCESGQFSDLPKYPRSSLLIDEALRCGLFHGLACSCAGSSAWGVVRSCSKCDTDFCLSKQTLPGEARVLVFTIWQNGSWHWRES